MKPRILVEGLGFPEGPRWHRDRLWFSDMYHRKVLAVDINGNVDVIVETECSPSGLGWTARGDLLIVSMQDRRLLRFDGDALTEMADLSRMAATQCNDMLVDKDGYAYVGNFGFALMSGEPPKSTFLIGVSPEGEISQVAKDLVFPNGMAISADGQTLVVAETFANRLTAFDIQPDKSLVNRRIWASLEDCRPDGIAMDKKGGVWVAPANNNQVIRVEANGQITDRIGVSQGAFACALGGAADDLLFVCTAQWYNPGDARMKGSGRIEVVELVGHR